MNLAVIVWSYLIVEYHLFCIEINHTWHWVSSVEGQAHQRSHYRSPQGSTTLQLHQHFISIALCSTLPLDPFHSSIPASVLFHQPASHVPMYMISNCIDLHPPRQKNIYCTWSGEKKCPMQPRRTACLACQHACLDHCTTTTQHLGIWNSTQQVSTDLHEHSWTVHNGRVVCNVREVK